MSDEDRRRSLFARHYEIVPVPERETYSPTAEVFKALLHFGISEEEARAVLECGEKFRPLRCIGPNGSHNLDRKVGPRYCRNVRLCGRDDNIERYGGADDMLWKMYSLFSAAGIPFTGKVPYFSSRSQALKEYHGPFWWAVDFTESADIWPRIRFTELSVLGALAYETMKEYFAKVWPMPVKFGMNVYVQAWHSEDPGKGWYPHVHSIIPRLFYRDDHSLVKSDLVWLNHEKVKLIWRRKVEGRWGKSRGGFKHRQDMFSVRVQVKLPDEVAVKLRRRGIRHRLRYMGRGFALDFTKYVNRGFHYDSWDREYVAQMLTGNGHKRSQSYGILSARHLHDGSPFAKHWGLALWTKRQRQSAARWRPCPDHPEGHVVLDFESEVEFSRKEAFDAGFLMMKPNFRAGTS